MNEDRREDPLQLVRRAQEGDPEALNALFDRYRPFVYKIVSVKLGRPVHAHRGLEDIVQDTLVKAFKGLGRFEPRAGPQSFAKWLAAIARRVVFDEFRPPPGPGGKAPRRIHGEDTSLSTLILPADGETPSQLAIGAETEGRLFEALLSLPDHHRLPILYRKIACMPYEEVAARLKLKNVKVARSIVSNATKKLLALIA